MVTPTTWLSAFLLLLVSFFCFASWPNTFKRAGRWRSELFSCDFGFGALLFSVVAAYTLGTLGSALGFADRMLVAGRTDQGLAVVAGGCFALANMLFLSSISLIGMAAAFPLVVGGACVVTSLFGWKSSSPLFLAGGALLVIAAVVMEAMAIKTRGAALAAAAAPATGAAKGTPAKRWRISTKGIVVGVIGGVALGICLPVIYQATFNELGLGPYAALLLFCVGLFASTVPLNVYFMNIAIHGGPLKFSAYFNGNVQQHLYGFAGGAIWASGTLALGLALSVNAPNGLSSTVSFIVPALSVLLAMFWGLVVWKEYTAAPSALRLLLLSVPVFAIGIVVLGLGLAH